jgi:glutamyl/glutaminyl-tRNA synthetase
MSCLSLFVAEHYLTTIDQPRSTMVYSVAILKDRAFILSCLFALLQVDGFIHYSSCKLNPSLLSRRKTALQVSELHVRGYAQTKLPFILQDEHLQQENADGTISLRKIEELSYSCDTDCESLIPYEQGHLLHKTKHPIFSAEECQRIVDEAEKVASESQWTTNRHGNFPTTDLPLVELPETLKFLRLGLAERIYPLLRSQFGQYLPDPSRLRVADGFVVKYDAEGGQKELKPHRDGSVVSFNIALNPATDYDGGGTWFASLDDAVKIDQGEIVTHASGLLHGGQGITKGKRYIMVAFVILEGYDSWSMRFYNQVRNL